MGGLSGTLSSASVHPEGGAVTVSPQLVSSSAIMPIHGELPWIRQSMVPLPWMQRHIGTIRYGNMHVMEVFRDTCIAPPNMGNVTEAIVYTSALFS